jgi:hypothetical protein
MELHDQAATTVEIVAVIVRIVLSTRIGLAGSETRRDTLPIAAPQHSRKSLRSALGATASEPRSSFAWLALHAHARTPAYPQRLAPGAPHTAPALPRALRAARRLVPFRPALSTFCFSAKATPSAFRSSHAWIRGDAVAGFPCRAVVRAAGSTTKNRRAATAPPIAATAIQYENNPTRRRMARTSISIRCYVGSRNTRGTWRLTECMLQRKRTSRSSSLIWINSFHDSRC